MSQKHRWKQRHGGDDLRWCIAALNGTWDLRKPSRMPSFAPQKVTKTLLLQRPRLPFTSHRLPGSSHYATCNPSISLSDLLSAHRLVFSRCPSVCPPSFFLFSSSFPSLFLHSHTQHKHTHTKKSNYNTAKPIWEQQASHSVVEGGWNACCHQTSKLQHDKPTLIARPVQQRDHSSAMWADLIIRGTLL